MRNKGFTLLELLAVIVILAIIALIAMPIIINLISDSKESSNKISMELYAKSVAQAIAREELTAEVPNGAYTTVDGSTIERKGESIKIEYDGNPVICTIIIKTDDTLFLNGCTIGGVSVDYSYGNIKGDLNGDGFVTEMDKALLSDIIAGNAERNDKADLNGDGYINGTDQNILARILTSRYDLNDDGVVNSDDTSVITNIRLGYMVATDELKNRADLNGDGYLTAIDENIMKRYINYINS